MSLRRTLDKQRNEANVPHRGRNRDGTSAFSRTPTALSEVSYPCPERSLLQAPKRPHGAARGSSPPVRRRNTGTGRPTMGCVAMGRTNPTRARLACRDRAQAAAHTRKVRNASGHTSQNAAPGLWRGVLKSMHRRGCCAFCRSVHVDTDEHAAEQRRDRGEGRAHDESDVISAIQRFEGRRSCGQ